MVRLAWLVDLGELDLFAKGSVSAVPWEMVKRAEEAFCANMDVVLIKMGRWRRHRRAQRRIGFRRHRRLSCRPNRRAILI
jgi:hypothetical protein